MKFIEKDLTTSNSGEQVKSAIACTFRNHAAAVKATALQASGKTFGFDKFDFSKGKFNGE